MTAKTLVLNIQEIPVSIVKARRAITLVSSNKAVIKAVYADTIIRSSGSLDNLYGVTTSKNTAISMAVPSVIQCTKSTYIPKKFTNVLPFTRQNLYIRDFGVCMYCGKKISLSEMTFDHVIPKSLGGRSYWDNVVLSCTRCNSEKGNRPVGKFKEPIRAPYIPKLDKAAPSQLVSRLAAEIPHKTWVDWIYWNVVLQPI